MGGAHEKLEHAEHVEHAAGHNKQIALLIAVIALFLAISETFGKSAQTSAISDNVEAANLWAFFQAKTIRMTAVRTAAEAMAIEAGASADPAVKAAIDKQIAAWRATAARYDDEPDTGEGRKQLMARAQAAEHSRDTNMAKYHHFELASAAFQVGIVLASAAVITGVMALAFTAGALSIGGLILMGIGLFAPHAVHLM
ncbi:MAG: DUF4337 domain-containing protein [Rhodoplanes sp.]|jgi:hypothetical protein